MVTLCLSGSCLLKAGENCSTDFTGTSAEDNWNALILQAESYICSVSRQNWIDDYAGLNADLKYILEDLCSCIAAMYAISYDMSGFTSRFEAETMLDVLNDRIEKMIVLLKEKKVVDFIKEV